MTTAAAPEKGGREARGGRRGAAAGGMGTTIRAEEKKVDQNTLAMVVEDGALAAEMLESRRAVEVSPLGEGILRYRDDVVGAGEGFAYSDAPADVAAAEAARRIKELSRRTVENIVEIGGELVRVKKALKHGRFLEWLGAEFSMSERSARNLIAVHERFKSATLADLGLIDVTALYRLAAPSTPPEVRQEALDRAASGERVTTATVNEMLGKPAPSPKPNGAVQITTQDYEVVAVGDGGTGPEPAAGIDAGEEATPEPEDEVTETDVFISLVNEVKENTKRYKTRSELIELALTLTKEERSDMSAEVAKIAKWLNWVRHALAEAQRAELRNRV